jgi:hypothetical protein
MAVPIKAGDTVMLRRSTFVGNIPEGRQDNRSAKVRVLMQDYSDGALFLDRDLRGSRYWHRSDVQLLRSA